MAPGLRGVVPTKVPCVSVIVPTYNRARDIGRCLESLSNQTLADFEVIVCDDGSTDGTEDVVTGYRERLALTYHWAENFGGPARPRNIGLELARGGYVAFLDSDDWWTPDKLERSVRRLDAGADIVYHDLYRVRSVARRRHWRRVRTRRLFAPVFDDLLERGNTVPNSSVVVRRELMRRVGGFSEDRSLIAWEDYDAWLRLARVTERFARLSAPLGYYWDGGNNISSPRRLIANLERFRELYGTNDLRSRQLPPWYHYSMGLAYHQLGSHGEALAHMRRALAGGLPAVQGAKALGTAALSSVHSMLESR
jgi:glycosyltransferase involved in cell wall biosynthesis